jgi:hypothetical protein
VLDPTAEKEGDQMELSVTSAAFSGCTNFTFEAEGLPWVGAADAPEYEALAAVELGSYTTTAWFGSCVYNIEGLFHHILEKYTTINRVKYIDVTGKVGKVGAPTFLCPKLLRVSYTVTENLISDPNLPSATYTTIS